MSLKRKTTTDSDTMPDHVKKRAIELFERGWRAFEEAVSLQSLMPTGGKNGLIDQISEQLIAKESRKNADHISICNKFAQEFWENAFPGRPLRKCTNHNVVGSYPVHLSEPCCEYYCGQDWPITFSEGSISVTIDDKWTIKVWWHVDTETKTIDYSCEEGWDKIMVNDYEDVNAGFTIDKYTFSEIAGWDKLSGDDKVILKHKKNIVEGISAFLVNEGVFPKWLEFSLDDDGGDED